jgi:hypothetical protein
MLRLLVDSLPRREVVRPHAPRCTHAHYPAQSIKTSRAGREHTGWHQGKCQIRGGEDPLLVARVWLPARYAHMRPLRPWFITRFR